MAEHISDRIEFALRNGSASTALFVLINLHNGLTLVACMDEDEENDAPVNMAVEYLRDQIIKRHALKPEKIVWVEYTNHLLLTDEGSIGGWELVTFPNDGEPNWKVMTPDDWKHLGTVPPLGPDELQRRDRRAS